MAFQRNPERAVDRTRGDRGVIASVAFPEQHRSALLAEAAPCRLARPVPLEAARLDEAQILVLGARSRHVASGLLAALRAMAGDHRAQRARNLELHRTAETRSRLLAHWAILRRISAESSPPAYLISSA